MVFSSLVFLCLFLPVFLIVYFTLPKLRTVTLVVFSLAFYAFGEPIWVLALVLSGSIDYFLTRIIGSHPNTWHRKAALAASLILNIGLLFTVKYSGFVVSNINALFGATFTVPSFALPLGISFYTFQKISYTVDVYSGKSTPQKSYLTFMSYVTMFPQLISGPIIRYGAIEERLTDHRVTVEDFSAGITKFAIGLGKKVLLASAAGSAVDTLFYPGAKLTTAGSWLGIIFYAFQLYFDFSGYTDMAIGLGRMMGFKFPENFNYPYIARSVSDFWRRWHISLSSFFRDYVYIPLGGNRRHQLLNIVVVWFLTGFWHGASWNFIIWGLFYGVLLIIEKLFFKKILDKIPRVFGHLYAILAILIGRGLFYFTSAPELLAFFKAAFGVGVKLYDVRFTSVLQTNALLLPILILGCTPLPAKIAKKIRGSRAGILEPVYTVATMGLSFVTLVGQTYSPFLYFKF